MVEMQVRAQHHIDVVALQADAVQRGDDIVAGLHDRGDDLGDAAPARFRVLGDVGMAARVKQHVALAVAQENAGHRHVHGLAARRVRLIHGLAHAQAAAGEDVHLHRALPSLSATERIALMMCS